MSTVMTSPSTEKNLILEGMPWQHYENISSCFQDVKSVRISYLEGNLEIMSPVGEEHETLKSNLSVLLETWLSQKDMRFYRRGGFTLKKTGIAAGEPDESYCIETNKTVPDLVIEIVVSSGALNKLPLYQAKQIPEVWIWQNGALQIYILGDDGYQSRSRSGLLPYLDIALLAAHVEMPDQYDAVQAFKRALA